MPQDVAGHFAPGVVRFVMMQHVPGQVSAKHVLAQLLWFGLRISRGQVVALLNGNHASFRAEKDAILEAGLATARWVTVGDTGIHHADSVRQDGGKSCAC